MMKKMALAFFIVFPVLACAADCVPLTNKYHAPNPASKTIAQIERWVKNRVDNPKDAALLRDCLISGAADNPNQASYAGKGGTL